MSESSASAKIILFGEHSVVYHRPALAVPFSALRVFAKATPSEQFNIVAQNLSNQRFTINDTSNPLIQFVVSFCQYHHISPPTFQISINSQIPIASGLGSGAAISTALGRVLCDVVGVTTPIEDLNNMVYETEKRYHGTPSGIDNTVIVYEKPIRFVKSEPISIITEFTPFRLIVADTGHAAPTYESVGDVRRLYEQNPAHYNTIFDEIANITNRGLETMKSGDISTLGNLMTKNHYLLQALTVSSPLLDTLVSIALQAGALGAKLSGGGRGGNMIALVTPQIATAVQSALLTNGATRAFLTEVRP